MGIVTKDFDWMFNDVQFALDVKSARLKMGLKTQEVATKVGYVSSATIVQIERADYTDGLPVKRFLKLCNLLNLHANDYFEIEERL